MQPSGQDQCARMRKTTHSKRRSLDLTFLYFAYGSNMLTARLKRRCDGADPVGIAYANDRMIEFSKLSCDGSGKATLRHAPGRRTPGVLFEIPSAQSDALDRAEGFPNGYDRRKAFPVFRSDGRKVRAVTYLAKLPEPSLDAYDWYLALVIAGALGHELDVEHVAALRSENWIPDPMVDRSSRCEAIRVLALAGHRDYRKLLT